MFNPQVVAQIAQGNKQCLLNMAAIEDVLNRRFYKMEKQVRALILAVLSGEPLLLIGPPGTSKSRLIRSFCGCLGFLNLDDMTQEHPAYFEYLLTPFTEPGELFGYYDLSQAQHGKLVRIDKNTMQQAKIIYLDEVFNGSSAILNSLLAFLQERIFHDRGERRKVAMRGLFGATNQIPETSELRAVFDRFLLRCHVDNVDPLPVEVEGLLKTGWMETYTKNESSQRRATVTNPEKVPDLLRQGNTAESLGIDILADVERFRDQIQTLTRANKLLLNQSNDRLPNELARMIEQTRRYELSSMSNRRLVKMLHLMLVHRVYEAVRAGRIDNSLSLRKEEYLLIPQYLLDRYDDEESIRHLEGMASNVRL